MVFLRKLYSRKWLKDSLLVEQRYLCCYCECRIDSNNSHVEHFKPKASDQFPELQLDYNNLHASCGCNVSSGEDTHCGHRKKDLYTTLLVSPLEEACHCHFKYRMDGSIIGVDERGSESISLLRLDSALLNAQRKSLIDFFLSFTDTKLQQEELKLHLDPDKDRLGEFYTMVESLF